MMRRMTALSTMPAPDTRPKTTTRPKALTTEFRRIAWTEGLARTDLPRWKRWANLVFVVAMLLAGAIVGERAHSGDDLLHRIQSNSNYLKIAAIYVAYEAVMKVVEAAKEDPQREFEAAIEWVTYPIRTGVPLAAIGFLIGDTIAAHLSGGASLAPMGAVAAVCGALVIAGFTRAAFVAATSQPDDSTTVELEDAGNPTGTGGVNQRSATRLRLRTQHTTALVVLGLAAGLAIVRKLASGKP